MTERISLADELTELAANGVPVEYRAGVATQLAALRVQAKLVEEFALPDDTEPAKVFTP